MPNQHPRANLDVILDTVFSASGTQRMPRESPLGSIVPGSIKNASGALNPVKKLKLSTFGGPSPRIADATCGSEEDSDNDGAHTVSGFGKMSSFNCEHGPSEDTPYHPLQYPWFYNATTPTGEEKDSDDDDF
jgi:hypothetical protein